MECKDDDAHLPPDGDVDLIETSWNVKLMEDVPVYETRGFNRNIVECKVQQERNLKRPQNRFNRNIVECKASLIEDATAKIEI